MFINKTFDSKKNLLKFLAEEFIKPTHPFELIDETNSLSNEIVYEHPTNHTYSLKLNDFTYEIYEKLSLPEKESKDSSKNYGFHKLEYMPRFIGAFNSFHTNISLKKIYSDDFRISLKANSSIEGFIALMNLIIDYVDSK